MSRIMLDEYKTFDRFWVEAVNTTCHATNRLYHHKLLKKTSYELLTDKKPSVSHFQVFGSKCYVIQKRIKSSKFAPKVYEGFLVMIQTLAYMGFSTRTLVVLKPYVMRCLIRLMALKWSNLILML
jgi:hypothetical protein